MAKYSVRLKESVFYTVETMGGADEAGKLAVVLWEESPDPDNDYCGAGSGVGGL